jgi:hypothetical protein
MAALMRPQVAQQSRQAAVQNQNKAYPGKLTQIKEFPIEKSNQQPYKLQKALIDQKIVPCINVRPYVFHDLMMSLPDFVKHFFPDLPLEKSREMLQEILKVRIFTAWKLRIINRRQCSEIVLTRRPAGGAVQGEHGAPGGAAERGEVRGVRPGAARPRQGHHDLHAADEVHV